MSTMPRRQLDHSNPPFSPPWQGGAWGVALADLCDGFFEDRSWVTKCETLEADDIPQPARRLLVHHRHMTATLKAHHGQDVELRVLADRLEGDHYSRKIILTLPGRNEVVEFGIARIDLRFTDEEVRAAVLGRKLPLGAILIGHGVMTKVTPRWYLRLPVEGPLAAYFGKGPVEAYGRLATIHCNGDAAVELLEIVPGASRR